MSPHAGSFDTALPAVVVEEPTPTDSQFCESVDEPEVQPETGRSPRPSSEPASHVARLAGADGLELVTALDATALGRSLLVRLRDEVAAIDRTTSGELLVAGRVRGVGDFVVEELRRRVSVVRMMPNRVSQL
jgi:hypothetical protein